MKIAKTPFRKFFSHNLNLPTVLFVFLLINILSGLCFAVTTRIFRQDSFTQLSKGKTKDVLISSKGTIELGLSNETLIDKFETGAPQIQPWSINCIAVNGTSLYLGTSPNGEIFKYGPTKLIKIYPQKSDTEGEVKDEAKDVNTSAFSSDANEPNKPAKTGKVFTAKEYLSNEHVYAMNFDISGNLLAAISGSNGRLLRFKNDKPQTVFEPNDVKYIFAIATDRKGNIYLGTGPQGKIYRLDSFAKNPKVIYQAKDKNILSLAIGADDFIYAGSDERGIVYKINPRTSAATVLYDSEQPEITALTLDKDGNLYAAATSAQISGRGARFTTLPPTTGRPETPSTTAAPVGLGEGGRRLQIPVTRTEPESRGPTQPPPPSRGTRPAGTSAVYKITPAGFVTEVFSETAVFFSMILQSQKLLVGTGNEAQLFSVDIDTEQKGISFADTQASQITAVAASDSDIYLGTANPAKLIKVNKLFAKEGTYTSDLIDATQPAKWGKLQIEADIPKGCLITVSARSGNVKDINDPAFSAWSEPVEITQPVQLDIPVGRFCQYKLVLKSEDGRQSPVIREIATASTVPNLAPKVESVTTTRLESANKEGFFKIDYKAGDENSDKLVYKIDLKKIGTEKWIELKDQLEAATYEWDGRTVEDGRYEIRVTASDEKSNTPATALTGSRVSDPLIVDNTPPIITKLDSQINKKELTIKLSASDLLSTISKVSYTIDSSTDWLGVMPDDGVFDSTTEDFTILIKDMKSGEHIISLRISDAANNTMYKSLDIKIPEK